MLFATTTIFQGKNVPCRTFADMLAITYRKGLRLHLATSEVNEIQIHVALNFANMFGMPLRALGKVRFSASVKSSL